MKLIYGFLSQLFELILPLTSSLNKKMALFVEGRKQSFSYLENQLLSEKEVIWFHAASLGEYEQGLPIMKALKKQHPEHQLLVTFFSPSGYEVKKNDTFLDAVCYLPIDTPKNAKRFVELVQPKMVFFIKYEIWPNYLFELEKTNIPTYLISGLFRANQHYFKFYGRFFKKALLTFDKIFVQNKSSLQLLKENGFKDVFLSGDTRFDRVNAQLTMNNSLDFVEEFIANETCFVLGSTWPEDEEIFMDFVNNRANLKFIIAPHEVHPEKVEKLVSKIQRKTILYSEKDQHQLNNFEVLLIDTVGLLTKIYAYADIAYVGGGMGTSGLHNILEPAAFNVPIIIGKHFEKFPEAKKLRDLAGLYSVDSIKSFNEIATKLVENKRFREQTGMICGHYIEARTGATSVVLNEIFE
ncbi:MAG: 3-deoxy-D-manno-octulosonic acid transferase [Bacteroidota bacterium]